MGRERQGAAGKAFVIAWLVTAVYYFYQYSLRSAPGVMVPQLAAAFGIAAAGVASLAGLFYYGYSIFSLVAGVTLDRFGARRMVPMASVAVGVGALLFASGNHALASVGRLLQGAGGTFALIGAFYLIANYFPANRAATMTGATQMFGMAGGSAGQFVVGPMIAAGVAWSWFWAGMGILGLLIGGVLFVLLPGPKDETGDPGWVGEALRSMGIVFRNPQSIVCGFISGLLFIPTTIFDMVWGVRYMQDVHGFDYGIAVMRSATVPAGWMIGAPLLGFISDRIGRRKPVIVAAALVLLACLGWILYGPADVLPPYLLGLLAGVASGAAMIPYSVIKEANPRHLAGTASGVINFINFTFSALLGPVFATLLTSSAAPSAQPGHEHYQIAFSPMLAGVVLAIILTFLLRETGPAVTRPVAVPAEAT